MLTVSQWKCAELESRF